jgi:tRNA(Arg) A34 adenosine deaminase TadA
MDHERWMRLAIEQARAGIRAGQSPFGSVIVRAGALVAAGHNSVWERTDPTAHAEVVTIQLACRSLGSIDLRGCTLYSTCEPCPMCASAIHWSKLDAVCFGAAIEDARGAGFSELGVPIADLYARGGSPVTLLPRVLVPECAELFAHWLRHPAHRSY